MQTKETPSRHSACRWEAQKHRKFKTEGKHPDETIDGVGSECFQPGGGDPVEVFRSQGDVSVLIGSTEKMGTGWKVQPRLAGEHHVDVPVATG
jgi:hypothetical protein